MPGSRFALPLALPLALALVALPAHAIEDDRFVLRAAAFLRGRRVDVTLMAALRDG